MKARIVSLAALTLIGSIALSHAAQAQTPTTNNYNYVGLGLGVGDLGDSDLGLAINSKLTVGNQVSVRPGLITDFDFSDGQTSFTLPVTYDFNPITPNGKLLPYAGGGIAAKTGDDSEIAPLLTAGVDYRLSDKVTINGSVNWSIYENSDVNGVLGVGYTF
ncbi:MAG: outer membrane protein [Leptolyngbyaceae cyanobacterium]